MVIENNVRLKQSCEIEKSWNWITLKLIKMENSMCTVTDYICNGGCFDAIILFKCSDF